LGLHRTNRLDDFRDLARPLVALANGAGHRLDRRRHHVGCRHRSADNDRSTGSRFAADVGAAAVDINLPERRSSRVSWASIWAAFSAQEIRASTPRAHRSLRRAPPTG
jgi:hypothetical protein